MEQLDSVSERALQRAVRVVLADPSRVRHTVDGLRLQVLAPGRINVHAGPDFLDMAILLGSDVLVGSAEFHRNSSDWLAHGHDSEAEYAKVILHIVLDDDQPIEIHAPTLVLEAEDVRACLRMREPELTEVSLEDIHTYSLLRLLRQTAEQTMHGRQSTAIQTFRRAVHEFLKKYVRRRRRPTYREKGIDEIVRGVQYSPHARFICALDQGECNEVMVSLSILLDTPFAGEGAHLRRELFVNCLLPCALAVARNEARIDIFEWYWSLESLQDYGVLQRVFRGISQQYLWQQQGMLEMMREQGLDATAHDHQPRYGLMQRIELYSMALQKVEQHS